MLRQGGDGHSAFRDALLHILPSPLLQRRADKIYTMLSPLDGRHVLIEPIPRLGPLFSLVSLLFALSFILPFLFMMLLGLGLNSSFLSLPGGIYRLVQLDPLFSVRSLSPSMTPAKDQLGSSDDIQSVLGFFVFFFLGCSLLLSSSLCKMAGLVFLF